jgi:hypothetical protein
VNETKTGSKRWWSIIAGLIGIPLLLFYDAPAQEKILARVVVTEPLGVHRETEYIELSLQVDDSLLSATHEIFAFDVASDLIIPGQIFDFTKIAGKSAFGIVFPVSLRARETRTFLIRTFPRGLPGATTDLALTGEGTELCVANSFYAADLTRSDDEEPKNHPSGQIRELLIKMGFNQLLTNAEDRVHWAPNFKRPELEYYTTIAHWQNPKIKRVESGPYLVRTVRQDWAPAHPEILLTAVYKFYANVPYFRFYSSMEMQQDVWLGLLRNDEMTMDSMFTHLAFQRPDGEVVEVEIEKRHELLKVHPIEDDAPWLCFYHRDKGFAFGTIRLKYDNTNEFGESSPTYQPHTQIGQWLNRRYWNRRLIHDHLTFVPKGSRYLEENAYLVFRIGDANRFEEIQNWAKVLRNPVRISVTPM